MLTKLLRIQILRKILRLFSVFFCVFLCFSLFLVYFPLLSLTIVPIKRENGPPLTPRSPKIPCQSVINNAFKYILPRLMIIVYFYLTIVYFCLTLYCPPPFDECL